MSKETKSILTLHITLWGLILLNYVIKEAVGVGLMVPIAFMLISVLMLSGVYLFFQFAKPLKIIGDYLPTYPFISLILFMGLVVGGVFGGLIVSIALSPISPGSLKHKVDELVIYNNTKGVMGMCCNYAVKERQFWIFEKDLGEFQFSSIDFEESTLHRLEDGVSITFPGEYHNLQEWRGKDTTFVIK